MSKRIDVSPANRYGLKRNQPDSRNGYVSFELGFRRSNGDLPGEVKLDVDKSKGGAPKSASNCGCN